MEGKVALVTGAASGMGRCSAIAFAKKGAKVVVVDIDSKGGEETVKIIRSHRGDASFIRADVSKVEDVKNMVEKTIDLYGGIHFAHNNAGIEGEASVTHSTSIENFDKVMSINCRSVFLCMKYEIEQMLKQKPCNDCPFSIVNTSSSVGFMGFAEFPAYCASKHAVNGLTQTAALEYAKQGIRVNAVNPGATNTPMVARFKEKWSGHERWSNSRVSLDEMYPVGRIGTPEEIAEAVIWLSSPACTFMTGVLLPIDGGYGCK